MIKIIYQSDLTEYHKKQLKVFKKSLSDDSIVKDRSFFLEAVKSNGRALQFASESLKADKEIVLEAVKSKGWALKYASELLKADEEVLKAAGMSGEVDDLPF